MTWQESLRQLDLRLANGDISANEYRRTRDEILAEASSNSAADAKQDPWVAVPATGGATENGSENGSENAEAEAQQDPGETTIVVKTDQVEEDTQIVSGDAIRPAAATAATAAPATPSTPAAPVLPPPPPPPAGPVAPDVRQAPYPVAPIQGHEVFAEASSNKGGVLTRFLVPLLILAVVGAGVWWFVIRDSGEDPAGASPPPSTQAQEEKLDGAAVADLLPELPGKANANNGELALDRARELKLFTQNYATLLGDNGAEQIVYRGAVGRGVGYLLVASPVGSAQDAAGVVEATTAHLERAGFKEAPEVSPGDPRVITRTDQAFRTFIAVYSSGNVWVQLNVSGAPDGDEQELRTEFQKVLGTLTERLPAD